MDKVSKWIFEWFIALSVVITILGVVFIYLPISQFSEYGALYKVQLGNVSSEQCTYASTSVRDIKFLGVTSEIDPCTLNTVYWYNYQVTWKVNAEQWLLSYLAEDGIVPLIIETSDITLK